MSIEPPSSPRVAVITGGEGDLAQAIRAELLAQEWIVHAPGRGQLDVTSRTSVRAWFGELDRVDLLINNAGVIRDRPVLRMTEADFEQVTDVCLKGAFLCSQAVIQKMARQRSGHILHIGSFSGLHGPVGQANYAAAKAGLVGLTKSLAKEYGKRNIRVNCVLPGFLETRMTADLLNQPGQRERVLADHALGRLNTPRDAARFIATLDTLNYISGQVFQLDSRVTS